MARVSINVRKILRDTVVFEKKINYAIQQVVIEYVTDFVRSLSDATPLGNPEERDPFSRYYKLYELRRFKEGHRIEGGLARGNWRVTFRDGVTGIVQNYDKSPEDTAIRAFERMDGEYTLNKPVYIVNNVKYINKLRDGYSPQAPAGTIDAVMQNYQSLAKYRNIFNSALQGV
jgi:hypothetical protein